MISDRLKSLGGSATSGMRNRARKLREAGIRVVNFAAGAQRSCAQSLWDSKETAQYLVKLKRKLTMSQDA